jgi:hypothetical protein
MTGGRRLTSDLCTNQSPKLDIRFESYQYDRYESVFLTTPLQAILSAPAYDESGTGSSEATPVPLNLTGEFGTISNGAPAIGTDPNDPNIYYVNSYPATAIAYGIVTAAPHAIGGAPGLVLSGVNVGSEYVPSLVTFFL